MPAPAMIGESQWRQYCESWESEYRRRVAAVDDEVGNLRAATSLPDEKAGIRARKVSLALGRLAALIRVDFAGDGQRSGAGGIVPDPDRDGEIAGRYAGMVDAVRAAARTLGLETASGAEETVATRRARQTSALRAMSDKEFAGIASACASNALDAFGLRPDERAVATERERRVAGFAQATLAPCLERLVNASPAAEALSVAPSAMAERVDDISVHDIGARLREATDALQAVLALYSACDGKLDGADATAAFIEDIVTRTLPDLRIAPARAQVLGRLCVALSATQAALAKGEPGFSDAGAGADSLDKLLVREDMLRTFGDRLDGLDASPDVIGGAFFALMRRTSFASMLAAYVSSAPPRQSIDDDATGTIRAMRDEEARILSDPGIRDVLQGDFGLEVAVLATPDEDSGYTVMASDAMGRHVEDRDTGRAIAVRKIYRQELLLRDFPLPGYSDAAFTAEPGSYAVSDAVNELYVVDYARGSCSLSVRGRAPDGALVSFESAPSHAPDGGDAPGPDARVQARAAAVEQALACLSRIVDAQGFWQITCLLSQAADASIFRAEVRADTGTPLRLSSGEPVIVGGRAYTHAVIEQNLDDTFDISVYLAWPWVNAAKPVGTDADSAAAVIELDPALSRKSVRYVWRLRPGGDAVARPLQLADYRYRFVPALPAPENE
ncbi:hypothetical protein [Bordetella genomosp. 10]|uniref:hypothetical protein n=1 Tax=Bordetella genomosp. 10 TaxID=1416804 RepID=UPI0011784BDA|nr:hypothetical protein [Bordetella genomosp. 10]